MVHVYQMNHANAILNSNILNSMSFSYLLPSGCLLDTFCPQLLQDCPCSATHTVMWAGWLKPDTLVCKSVKSLCTFRSCYRREMSDLNCGILILTDAVNRLDLTLKNLHHSRFFIAVNRCCREDERRAPAAADLFKFDSPTPSMEMVKV